MKQDKKTKRKSRRSLSKYPNLEKEFTLLRRLEFLETDYVDGTFDKDGKMVIRKLNEEEKKWLDQYYKETLNTTFSKTDSFYPVEGIGHLSKKEIKELRQEFMTEDKSIDYDMLENKRKVRKIAKEYKISSETAINLIKRKEIYDANNSLNADYMKNSLRSTCEGKEDTDEDYFHPIDQYYVDQHTNIFEDAMNGFLDIQHRIEMGWDEIEE